MGPPAALTKRQSTYEPPVGKLSPDCFDLPFGDSAPGGIVWVVAVDGSTTSMRGVRLASFLMNAKAKDVSKGRDYVLVINVIKPGEVKPTALFGDCVEELRKCGLNVFKQVHCQTVERPDEWGVGDALVYFSNHVNMGHARLIIGGPGVHEAAVPGKSGKWKQLGSIAEQCLTKVKVPVVLVKGMWGTDPQGDRNAIGRVCTPTYCNLPSVPCPVPSSSPLNLEPFFTLTFCLCSHCAMARMSPRDSTFRAASTARATAIMHSTYAKLLST